MKKKKYLIIIFSSFLLIFASIGLVNINIINTKALSPVGNTDDNKKIVNTEFGEEFNSFIQDNSNVKIYNNENEGEYLVTINDKRIKIKEESYLISGVKKAVLAVKNISVNLINDIEALFEKIMP
ncbi:hypothetical protein [Clostridium sardiniense]|uniref:hypothetical protein n=1 Tax=Clostridium sardiniense TaxID=29369 RepID=UPI003D350349